MEKLSKQERQPTGGGFHLNVGVAIFSIVGGFIIGGPVGAGIAAGAVIGGQGVNNLIEMGENEAKIRQSIKMGERK